jgi:hypothetical protein
MERAREPNHLRLRRAITEDSAVVFCDHVASSILQYGIMESDTQAVEGYSG